MSVYTVLSNLKRDGAFFAKGEEIELDDKEVAEQLVEDGVIEPAVKKGPMTPEQKKRLQEAKPAVAAPAEDTADESVEEDETDEEDVEEAVEGKVDYSKMTKAELVAVVKGMGVKIPASAKTNAAIIKIIEKHEDDEALDSDNL